jgi:hypothetical protein
MNLVISVVRVFLLNCVTVQAKTPLQEQVTVTQPCTTCDIQPSVRTRHTSDLPPDLSAVRRDDPVISTKVFHFGI